MISFGVLVHYIVQCRYALWAVLLSLLTVTVAKPYYGNEGELLDSQSFFHDDESVIQGEAHFRNI